MISGMRKDILVAGFLLSIIDRYAREILLVCVNSFYRWKRYTDVGGVRQFGAEYIVGGNPVW